MFQKVFLGHFFCIGCRLRGYALQNVVNGNVRVCRAEDQGILHVRKGRDENE